MKSMRVLNFVKTELNTISLHEKIIFIIAIALAGIISLYLNDSKIALLCTICGILYTILAGNGRILCYLFGIIATLCYAYLSFKASLYGNFVLNMFYYFPMELIGIFNWKKNLKPNSNEIIKTKLNLKNKIILFSASIILTAIFAIIFAKAGGQKSLFDAFTCVFSVLGMFLTVQRCIEQWFVWMLVNAFSAIMWLGLFWQGENCFMLVIKWSIYFILAIYFWIIWRKELSN